MTTTPTDWRALCAELAGNLERYQSWYIEDNGYGIDDLEALLRRADAALAQPEPQGPTKGDISELYRKHGGFNYDGMDEIDFENAVNEAIARWGRPAVKPVPVAERLPGPEDCDAEGRCWWLTLAVADGGRGGYSTFWELTTFKAAARCASHWLPHHALPVPGAEVE